MSIHAPAADVVEILQAIVRDELRRVRVAEIGVVTDSFPHESDSDSNNYQSFGFDKYANKNWEENELRQRNTYTYDDYRRVLTIKNPLNKRVPIGADKDPAKTLIIGIETTW